MCIGITDRTGQSLPAGGCACGGTRRKAVDLNLSAFHAGADGAPAGFNTALLAAISSRMGENIELVAVDSVGRALLLRYRRASHHAGPSGQRVCPGEQVTAHPN